MWRLVVRQLLGRRSRSLAIVAAIVAAAVSFSLLSASVATSRLEVRGTVDANFRTAYDILVRPNGARTATERTGGVVQESFLSGIFGGITMRQYRQIQEMRDVEVAAPVAMVGYLIPTFYQYIKLKDLLTEDTQQIFRVRRTWVSQQGLSRHPEAVDYVYLTRQRADYAAGGVTQRDPVTGKPINPCRSFDRRQHEPRSAFDRERQHDLTCFSTNPPNPEMFEYAKGPFVLYSYSLPVLMAAIDPAAEAELVGLDEAVVDGRYLTADDRPRFVSAGRTRYRQLSVLMANEPLVDERLEVEIERLSPPDPDAVPSQLAGPQGLRWLVSLDGEVVRSIRYGPRPTYDRILRTYGREIYEAAVSYRTVGEVDYQRLPDGRLRPRIVGRQDPLVWMDPLVYGIGYRAPTASGDVGFRNLGARIAFATIQAENVHSTPILRRVGTYDPDLIQEFSALSKVPLTTYFPPDARGGDDRSKRLLGGKALLPDSNLAGYLQQPPTMLTTLTSLKRLTDSSSFAAYGGKTLAETRKAPLSVIRVRVAGVTGSDKLSRERVRLAAEKISRTTGLTVDITIGSSPTPRLIELPAGNAGRPELLLEEGWVSKGVTVELLDAIDAKSLALFALVLVVCLLFLLNATVAAVRTRRAELGVLACLGWSRRRILALLLAELTVTGLVAGLVGTTIATGLVGLLDLQIAWWQLAAITPVATILAVVAGLWPTWRACRARPIEAINLPVRAPRRAGRVSSITRLALVSVTRTPGRSALGAVSLFIGAAALSVLVAVQQQFQGGVTGTLLGDVVALQVRGVDYAAVALTIGLGAFAVADIAYLNINERTAEIGTFRAAGWAEHHLQRLFGTEGLLIAAIGALLGAATGVTTVSLLFDLDLATAVAAAVVAAGIGIVTAVAALIVPLARLGRIAPAVAITSE